MSMGRCNIEMMLRILRKNAGRRPAPQGILFLAAVLLGGVALAQPCDGLKSMSLTETTITAAQAYAAGAFTANKDLPAFCRVTATIKPSADSDIQIEVWMPELNWNGKLLGNGN